MLEQITKLKALFPSEGKKLDKKTKEGYNAKLIQWLTVTDSL